MAENLVKELINAGVHFGHNPSRWNPKMAPYIYAKRGKVHIIDIKKTLAGMLIAKKLLVNVVGSGKEVVFVGTKRQAQNAVRKASQKCGMHYVANRWLGGTLTNIRTIRSRLKRLEQLETMKENGTLEKESKKRASRLKRELRKIKFNLEGIREMSRLPGAVIVVDVKNEKNAIAEANKLGITTIGIIDTDSNPDLVDIAIPANDDSIKAVDIILNQLADAVAIGKTMASTQQMQTDVKAVKRRSTRAATAKADGSEGATQPAAVIEPKPAPAVEKKEEIKTKAVEPKVAEEKAAEPKTDTPKAAEEKAAKEKTDEAGA